MSESEFGCAERVPARGLESADSNWNRRAAEAVRKPQPFFTEPSQTCLEFAENADQIGVMDALTGLDRHRQRSRTGSRSRLRPLMGTPFGSSWPPANTSLLRLIPSMNDTYGSPR